MLKQYIYTLVVGLVSLLAYMPSAEARSMPHIAAQLSDSAFVSILTTTPSSEAVYTVYGHSAIRVCDSVQGIDIVFNYGIFNFNSPNFIYRFSAGETDYLVLPFTYNDYLSEYIIRGDEVREQILGLPKNEVQRIWSFLLKNILPENRVYRYNIFYNNCSTKLLDIVEANVDGKIEYPEETNRKTFRILLHEHLNQYPWLKFGIDLIIGSPADIKVTNREMLFLPLYEYNALNETKLIRASGEETKLVAKDITVVELNKDNKSENGFLHPLLLGLILLILSAITAWMSYSKNSVIARIFHTILFFAIGIAGCIVFFLMFFSVHPGTSANWNLVWVNPLTLIAATLFFAKSSSKCVYYYHFVNFVVIVFLLLAWCLIPQYLEINFIPYMLSLAMISGVQVVKYRKMKKN